MLADLTAEFFERHWRDSFGPTPEWTSPWPANSRGPLPCADMQGCYALYKGGDLIYVGLGASRGAGLYKGHGLGHRLYKHVLRIDWTKEAIDGCRFYAPRENWSEMSHLRMIGFPADLSYLAPALELFLLKMLPADLPLRNRVRPGS